MVNRCHYWYLVRLISPGELEAHLFKDLKTAQIYPIFLTCYPSATGFFVQFS
jgi:hypothetical protein